MRLILIGTPAERRALRDALDALSPDIVAECPSLSDARASGVIADALVLAPGRPARDADELAVIEPLTSRETEVLELVAEGLSNKEIGERLGISDQTVKFHVASIAGKLGAANRTDAVRRAVRAGLLTF